MGYQSALSDPMWLLHPFYLRHALHGFGSQRFPHYAVSSFLDHRTGLLFLCSTVHPTRQSVSNNKSSPFSSCRYHKVGALVLFLHDMADMCLQVTKLMRYMSSRQNGRQCSGWQQGSYLSILIFSVCW